jgi:small subunit ribosomal protein S21
MVVVLVSDQTKLDSAIRIFRKKGQKEGIIKEARRRKEYEKPCDKRRRKEQESASRSKRKKRKN